MKDSTYEANPDFSANVERDLYSAVIVANSNAIALATGGPYSTSPCCIVGAPDLSGLLLIPKSILGLHYDTAAEDLEIRLPRKRGDLGAHTEKMIEWIIEHSIPPEQEEQKKHYSELAQSSLKNLRERIDILMADARNDVSGLLDALMSFPPPCDEYPLSLTNRLTIHQIIDWYGRSNLETMVDRYFLGVEISNEERDNILDFVVRETRDQVVMKPTIALLCGLPSPSRRPHIQPIHVGKFIANEREISLPYVAKPDLGYLSGYISGCRWVAEAGGCPS